MISWVSELNKEKNNLVTNLLNATLSSIKTIISIELELEKPRLLKQNFYLNYGVLIGIVGDLRGKLVFSGDSSVFSTIGEMMYDMPLEGEMLQSFSGEMGNMIAGGISTNLARVQTDISITPPTILQGDTMLSGYEKGIELSVAFKEIGTIYIYLLIDN